MVIFELSVVPLAIILKLPSPCSQVEDSHSSSKLGTSTLSTPWFLCTSHTKDKKQKKQRGGVVEACCAQVARNRVDGGAYMDRCSSRVDLAPEPIVCEGGTLLAAVKSLSLLTHLNHYILCFPYSPRAVRINSLSPVQSNTLPHRRCLFPILTPCHNKYQARSPITRSTPLLSPLNKT